MIFHSFEDFEEGGIIHMYEDIVDAGIVQVSENSAGAGKTMSVESSWYRDSPGVWKTAVSAVTRWLQTLNKSDTAAVLEPRGQ